MLIKVPLAILALFKWFFPLIGVDYAVLRSLVEVKLLMDTRRDYKNINAKFNPRTGKQNSPLAQLLMLHLFTGAILIYPLHLLKSIFVSMFLFHLFLLGMSLMSLLTNYTSVLLDTSDNTILLPRPIDGRTLFVARSIHILTYLFIVAGTLALPGLGYGTYVYGPLFALGGVITLVLTTLLAYFFLYFLFFIILTVTGGHRFRELLTTIEIVFPLILTITFFTKAGHFNPKTFGISPEGLTYLAPPAWSAGLMEAMVNGNYHAPYLWHIVLAVVVPLLCMSAVVLFLAPAFDGELARMELTAPKVRAPRPGYTVASLAARLFCRRQNEQAAFEFIWKLTGRNRKYKLNTYPLVGSTFLFVGFIMLTSYKDIWDALNALPATRSYLGMIYTSWLVYLAAVSQLPYGDDVKASWIYRALPLHRPGPLITGAYKAVMAKFSIPSLVVLAVVLPLWGLSALEGLIFALANLVLLSLNMAFVFLRMLPFSHEISTAGVGDKLLVSLGFLALFAGLAGGHFYLIDNGHTIIAWACTAALIGVCFFLYHRFKNTTWEKIY